MLRFHPYRSLLRALSVVLVAAACSSNDMQGTQGASHGATAGGTLGAQSSGGISVASAGGVLGSTGTSTTSGAIGTISDTTGTGAGAAMGTGGVSVSVGAGGGPGGASGSVGNSGTGEFGQGITGIGGSVSQSGGTAGAGGMGGSAAASGSGGSSSGGSGSGGSGSGGGGSDGGMVSAGCGTAPSLASGESTIQIGGQTRSYILRIPDNYDRNHPYRLVFAYHWRGGTMQDVDGGGSSGAAWSYYGLREQADDSTIFVAPQGIGNGWANSGGSDLDFTDDMLALIQGDLCVDTNQIFALGFSYGGGMSYALACARAPVFRAVAVYSGGVLSGCDGGTEPIAYLGIHGLSDGTLDISGGRQMRDKFVMNNGCTAQNPPEPQLGSLTHTCTTYDGCAAGYPVQWCAFDGGHTPGMVDGGGDDGARTWTKTEVWKFFTQFQ